MTNVKKLGGLVKKWAHTDESLDILDSCPELYNTDWGEGGCGVLAAALMRIFPKASLWAIVDKTRPRVIGDFEHFVVELGGYYLDRDGASTHRTVLERWKRDYGGSPRLIPVPGIRWEDLTDILCPEKVVDETVKSLRKFLRRNQ